MHTCPPDFFAQEDPVRHCVDTCAEETWGDPVRRFCVVAPSSCPTINGTHYYAENTTHMCMPTCLAS